MSHPGHNLSFLQEAFNNGCVLKKCHTLDSGCAEAARRADREPEQNPWERATTAIVSVVSTVV
jgi:hypothetical protein